MRQSEEKREIRLWAVLFWLVVWLLFSTWIDSDILLVSPIKVLLRLSQLACTKVFWKTIFFTLSRIAFGFLLAVLAGSVLAGLSSRYRRIFELMTPFMLTVKSVPVASFIILALIWFSSRNLSILISFLMVLPIIYTNVLGGIRSVDRALLEMAEVFRIPRMRVVKFIYLPQIMPFFLFGVQCFAWSCMESGGCSRSDWHSKRVGWRANAAGKGLSGHSRFVCVDACGGGDEPCL